MSPTKAANYSDASTIQAVGAAPVKLAPMVGTAWLASGGMTITDVSQLRRLRRSELSASTSHSLDPQVCAVSMVASRLIPSDDGPFEANQLGTATHAVLEKLFQLPAEERTIERAIEITRQLREDRELADALLGKDLAPRIFALDEADTVKWFREVDRRVAGDFEIENPSEVTVFRTEMGFGKHNEFQATIGKVPFVGYVDRVDTILDPETQEIIGYAVKDYKAGHYKEATQWGDDYGDQIRYYVAALENAMGIMPSSGSLLFITDRKERLIDTSPEAVAVSIARFERAYDRMNLLADKNVYPTKVGPLCGWCELVNVCPAAIKAKKTDLSNTVKVNGRRVVGTDENGQPLPLKGIPASDLSIPTVAIPAPSDKSNGSNQPDQIRVIQQTPQPTTNAAHISNEAPEGAPTGRNTTDMITETAPEPKTQIVKEGVASSEGDVDGVLNSRSYAATSVFRIASLAVEQLAENGQPITGATVNALTQTYANVIQNAQVKLIGTADWNAGLNMRLLQALITTVKALETPWGQGATEWDQWAEKLAKRTTAIAKVAITTFNLGADKIPAAPWSPLVGATQSVNQAA